MLAQAVKSIDEWFERAADPATQKTLWIVGGAVLFGVVICHALGCIISEINKREIVREIRALRETLRQREPSTPA